nr:transposase family protein [Rhizobium leguminosarum]
MVSARAAADRRSCPLCSRMSDRVHSRYVRIIADLPCAGTKVQRYCHVNWAAVACLTGCA